MKVRFADVVARYLHARYRFGSVEPDACDCVSFIWLFYRDIGISLPDEFGGLTRETYPAAYESDPAAAKSAMLGWLRSLGAPIDPKRRLPGDLILLVQKSGEFSAMIDTGRGHCIGMHAPLGVCCVSIEVLTYDTLEVYRCRK